MQEREREREREREGGTNLRRISHEFLSAARCKKANAKIAYVLERLGKNFEKRTVSPILAEFSHGLFSGA